MNWWKEHSAASWAERLFAWWDWWRSDPKRMLKHCLIVLAVIWIFYGLQIWACSNRLRYEGPDWRPRGSARRAMSLYDDNGDGLLDTVELQDAPGLKAALATSDFNGDGNLDRDEIATRLGQYRDCRDYLLRTVCEVSLNGKPLPEATVRFIPDPCIKGTIPAASGVTNDAGKAVMVMEGRSPAGAGVAPGMYSVEVTFGGATGHLRAQYRKQPAFGYEADPFGGPEGLCPKFDLPAQ